MKLPARWHKIIHDLLGNRTRSILITLSIAVGLFAVGMTISSRQIIDREIQRGYQAITPSTGIVRLEPLFDEDFLNAVRAMPEVAYADARRNLQVRAKVGPEEWVNLTIFAVDDYENIRVNKIFPQEGAWPPPDHEILIERSGVSVIGLEIGDKLLIEMPNNKTREIRIAGTTYDLAQLPSNIDHTPYGYVTFKTLEWLGESYGFNEVQIRSKDAQNKEFATRVTNLVKDKAERAGYIIPLSYTAEPGQIPIDEILQALLLLMGLIGLLALFLSAFLIINTFTSLMTQQRRQIWVMKALGATSRQVLGMFLVMVLIFSLAAIILSIPLSLVGAQLLSRYMASLFNFNIISFRIPLSSILIQLFIGLFIPACAAIYPLMTTVGIPAARSITQYSVNDTKGKGWINRLFSGKNLWMLSKVVTRPPILALRNTFRSKARLVLTLITLTLAGGTFISVFSVRTSLMGTVDSLMSWWNFDVLLMFSRTYRIAEVSQVALNTPGISAVDDWYQAPMRRVRPDGSEGGLVFMFGPKPTSKLVAPPTLIAGRWLQPDDLNALVVSGNFLIDEPDIELGDEIVIKLEGDEYRMEIVGVTMGVVIPMVYAPYDFVADATGDVNRTNSLLVQTSDRSPEAVLEAAPRLEQAFRQAGLRVFSVQTIVAETKEAKSIFGIIVDLLLIMSILLAIVGSLGLMGTMSINVLERRREIGVLRAIGAPRRGVEWIFIMESLTIGILSWILGCLLALPIGKGLSNAVGVPIMGTPIEFRYSIEGIIYWLISVILLSILSSAAPARDASRLTVREVLAYE